MFRARLVVLVVLLSCARNQGTAPPTTTPAPSEPPPVATVPDDATVATAPEPADPPPEPIAKPRPADLAPPTEAEFAAWDRKDPEGEKKLAEFDQKNVTRLLGYWNDLACFRGRMRAEGELAFGAEPGSPRDERFYQFKQAFIVELDAWQRNFFAKEPRILEKSKFVGRFLEAHEIVMNNYPRAYASGDPTEIEKVEAHWVIVEAKTKKYAESLGATWPTPVCAEKPKAKKTSKKAS